MADTSPISSRVRKQTREQTRALKPYTKRKPSVFQEVKSVDKDYFNEEVAHAALEVCGLSSRALVLDHLWFQTASTLIAEGIPASAIDVVQISPATFAEQEKIKAARPELKEITLIQGDFFSVIKKEHKLLVLDLCGSCPPEDGMKIVRAWSAAQASPHALIVNMAGRRNVKKLATVRKRMAWLEEQLPSLHKHFEYGYKAAARRQPMYAAKFASWTNGETSYRPLKVVRTDRNEQGEKIFLVQWWGWPLDKTDWYLEGDSAVQWLKDEGRI